MCFTHTLTSWVQLSRSFNSWVWSQWNWLDAAILILYWVAFAVRLSGLSDEPTKETVKFLFAIVTLPLWLRTARYYAVSEFLGPKVRVSACSLV